MAKVFVITLYSGGSKVRTWRANEFPKPVADGAGWMFKSIESGEPVVVTGNVAIEQMSEGK